MQADFEQYADEVRRGLTEDGTFATFATFADEKTEWETPIPFATITTPPFPLDCLPESMAAFVKALSDNTQTPEEMAGVLALGVLATAFQSKYIVQITPDWKEPLCLYCVAVAPPGERKSAVISALTKPIRDYEAERRESERIEIARNRAEKTLLEKKLEAAKALAVKGKGDEQDVLDLAEQLETFKEMHEFRLLVDDTTPEKLVDLLDTQNGSISIASAEGGLFDTLSGRYEKNSNLDVYLKGHSGDPISIDRVSRKANYVSNPHLTMILTIQPEVLQGLIGNASFRGRGLCGRFLYAMCNSKIGHREVSPPPIPDEVKFKYMTFIDSALSKPFSGVIHLSPEADGIRKIFQAQVEVKLGDEWEYLRDWAGKLVGATIRIAALIHAAEVKGDPTEIPVSLDVMGKAIAIARCLSSHAEACYQVMGADKAQEDAKYLLRKIEKNGQDEISKRDLFNICKGRFKRVELMVPALQVLSDMGYLKEVEQKTKGRPTRKIVVNPLSKSGQAREKFKA